MELKMNLMRSTACSPRTSPTVMVQSQRFAVTVAALLTVHITFVTPLVGHNNVNYTQFSTIPPARVTYDRQKRQLPLVYLSSISVFNFICGLGIPVHHLEYEAATTGMLLRAQYTLPATPDDLKKLTPLKVHGRMTNVRQQSTFAEFMTRQRSSSAHYRWIFYEILAKFSEKLGHSHGRECVLRSICESAVVPFHYGNGLLGYLIHILFTPSSSMDELSTYRDNEYLHAEALGRNAGGTEACAVTFSECTSSFLTRISHILDDMSL